MSVGVCIINRNGIALAADSAGTFSGNKMFYNSMNKVFSLSHKNPYGAIVYGNLSFFNVSIEQMLKEFRDYIDDNDNINDFFDILPLFQEFVHNNSSYYKFYDAESLRCKSIIKDLIDNWGNQIKKVIELENAESKAGEILDQLEIYMESCLKIENYDVSQYIGSNFKDYFDERLSIVVPEIKQYQALQERFWDDITHYFNISMKMDTDKSTGVFFAGYGKNDAFPKFIHIEIYTVIDGRIKMKIIDRFEESDNNAQIIPLAQTDVVLTFCKGISNTFINYIPQKVEEIINGKIESLSHDFTEEQMTKIRDSFSTCKTDLTTTINAFIQRNQAVCTWYLFWRNILQPS